MRIGNSEMPHSRIERIGIVGTGRMGTDIFYLFNDHPFNLTWLCETGEEKERARDTFNKRLNRMLKNGLIDKDLFDVKSVSNVITCSPSDCGDCDIVIEAIHEDLDAKMRFFSMMEGIVSPRCVLASNSSSLIPSKIFSGIEGINRCAGLHFFYPVKLKNIAELIIAEETDNETRASIIGLLHDMDRFYLSLNEDSAFVLNRVFLDFQALAYRIHIDWDISFSAVDDLVKRHIFPAGVFDFFDSVGLDVMYASVRAYSSWHSGDFYLPLIQGLENMVAMKRFGKKSGAGFYDYKNGQSHGKHVPSADREMGKKLVDALTALYINSACRFLEKGALTEEEMEYAFPVYAGNDLGPLAMAEERGYKKVVSDLEEWHGKTGYDVFIPSKILR